MDLRENKYIDKYKDIYKDKYKDLYEKYKYKYTLLKDSNNALIGGEPKVGKDEIRFIFDNIDSGDTCFDALNGTGISDVINGCNDSRIKKTQLEIYKYFYQIKAYCLPKETSEAVEKIPYYYCTLTHYDDTTGITTIIKNSDETEKYKGKTIIVIRRKFDNYKLRDELTVRNLNWEGLCSNPRAIDLITKQLLADQTEAVSIINWGALSRNSNAIHLLLKYPDNIVWTEIAKNRNAMHLIETRAEECKVLPNGTKVKWGDVWDASMWNTISSHPNALNILEKYKNKIAWEGLSANPNVLNITKKLNLDIITNFNWGFGSKNPNIMSIMNMIMYSKHYDINFNDILSTIYRELNWNILATNPNAIPILHWRFYDKFGCKSVNKISTTDWIYLSRNPNALGLLGISQINEEPLSVPIVPVVPIDEKDVCGPGRGIGLDEKQILLNPHPDMVKKIRIVDIDWSYLALNTNPDVFDIGIKAWLILYKKDTILNKYLSSNPIIFV